MPKPKKTETEDPGSAPGSTYTEIPSTFTRTTATLTSAPVVTVTATVKGHSEEALKVIGQLRTFLKSRLHGPWNEIMLADAERLLDELTNLV